MCFSSYNQINAENVLKKKDYNFEHNFLLCLCPTVNPEKWNVLIALHNKRLYLLARTKGFWRRFLPSVAPLILFEDFSARPTRTATNRHPTRTCLLWRSRSWRHPPTRQLSRCSEWACRSRTARCPEGTMAAGSYPWRPRNGFLKYTPNINEIWKPVPIVKMSCNQTKKKSHFTQQSLIINCICEVFFFNQLQGEMYHLFNQASAHLLFG